jgi:hypothetical protein
MKSSRNPACEIVLSGYEDDPSASGFSCLTHQCIPNDCPTPKEEWHKPTCSAYVGGPLMDCTCGLRERLRNKIKSLI